MPVAGGGTPAEWTRAIRRNYGFLTQPERINVMFSRARQQLVIIGNFDFFADLISHVDDWGNAYGHGSQTQALIAEEQGFWVRLIDYLYPTYVVKPATTGRPRFE
jgi:hypothetical protein